MSIRGWPANLLPRRHGEAALDQAALVVHRRREVADSGHIDIIELLIEPRAGVVDLRSWREKSSGYSPEEVK